MLKQHNLLPNTEPLRKDFDIFKAIIDIIKNAESNDRPSIVQRE